MEHTLHDFLEETRLFVDPETKPKNKRTTQKQKIEGVWVLAQTPSMLSSSAGAWMPPESNSQEQAQGYEDEADEMIEETLIKIFVSKLSQISQ